MGQAIVTSHSPYVIEKFDPERIVVLSRDAAGAMTSTNVTLPADFKRKRYGDNRRQFAEAVLAHAVLVVEGATEAAAFPIVADILDQDGSIDYQHLDLAGVSIFDSGGDSSVPLYAPVFAAMGKPVYGIHDTPTAPFKAEVTAKGADFTRYEVIPHGGVEKLLAAEISVAVLRRFGSRMTTRPDYPVDCGQLPQNADDEAVRDHVFKLLKSRKGAEGYAPLLIAECADRAELPASMANFLLQIDTDLRPAPSAPPENADGVDLDGS